MPSWDDICDEGNELALWIRSRFQGEAWFTRLAVRWGTTSRAIRHFVRGAYPLKALTIYKISQDTHITMEALVEQNMTWKPWSNYE
jgi:hypothetical protein